MDQNNPVVVEAPIAPAPVAATSEAPVLGSQDIAERTPAEKAAAVQVIADKANAAKAADDAKKVKTLGLPKKEEVKVEEKKVEPAKAEEKKVEPVVEVKKEEPKVEVKASENIPKKFVKEDGTVDYDAMGKDYAELNKKLSSKNFTNISDISEYEYKPTDGAPAIPEANLKTFQEKALAAGLTKEQFALVMSEHDALAKQAFDVQVGRQLPSATEAKTVLEGVWGKDNLNDNLLAGQAAFKQFAPSGADMKDPVFSHPLVLQILANVAAELGEDALTGQHRESPATKLRSPQEIWKEADYKTNPGKYRAELDAYYASTVGNKQVRSSREIVRQAS